MKGSANAQIIIPLQHFIPGVFQVSLFIFLRQGRMGKGNILITYTYGGEINPNQSCTHNKGKSRDKCDMNDK